MSDPRINWLAECSHQAYIIDQAALKARIDKNQSNALIIVIFFGLWVGLTFVIPLLMLFCALIGHLFKRGDIP